MLVSGCPEAWDAEFATRSGPDWVDPLSKRRYLAAVRDNVIRNECGIPIDMNHSLLTQSFAESGH